MQERFPAEDFAYIFFNKTINDIRRSKETPNINFHFSDEDSLRIKAAAKLVIGMSDERADTYYERFFGNDPEAVLTIDVTDFSSFFKTLYKIILEQDTLNQRYRKRDSISTTATCLLRRIWLRMGPDDVNNVENFLSKQLEFLQNRKLDMVEPLYMDDLGEYKVYQRTDGNETWDETTRRMIFTLVDENGTDYELPTILYDIDESNACYIYGVQDRNKKHDPHIERKLYILNKGIDDPNVHPSKVFSLLLFMKELKRHNIKKVVVPTLQVLSYPYHEILSEQSVKNLEEAKQRLEKNPDNPVVQADYKLMQGWYDRLHNNQDKISYLKSEELANLVYRITLHDDEIEIMNDIDQSTDLNLRINRSR